VNPANHPSFDGHEAVEFIDDPATGLAGIIAIHSTARGPATGGCRVANYPSAEAALRDALRLSQGMSYKNALAGLPVGGGKAVLYKLGPQTSRAAAFEAFGAAVERLGGRYITAEDVGASVADMEAVARRTRFVAGLPGRPGCAGGDPSPWTALGIFVALEAALGRPVKGARVAVQGLGSVGLKLCQRLHDAGARLVVADVDADRTVAARARFGAEIEPTDRLHAADADVFSPNALGAGLNADTIPELGAPVVCGGANNQLEHAADGAALVARGITYAPDYVVNAGGIISVVAEYFREPMGAVEPRVRAIGPRLAELLARAAEERRPPGEIADRVARERIGRKAAELVT
jgi:leucine dehydrogenase